MTKKNYDETSVIRVIQRKNGVTVSNNKLITVSANATDVGNKTWGKIDYLCKVHGYSYMVSGVIAKVIKENNDKNEAVNKKVVKREAKLNMANMAKNAMRNARTK